MIQVWDTEWASTKEVIDKLNDFYTAQVALCLELRGAKQLGICKITTYVDPKLNFRNLDLTRENGRDTTQTVTILTKEKLKEML